MPASEKKILQISNLVVRFRILTAKGCGLYQQTSKVRAGMISGHCTYTYRLELQTEMWSCPLAGGAG